MSDRARTVVVGFDGSPTSRAALAWGAERAGDGGSLFVVYAFDLPPDMLGGTTYQHAVADHKEHGRTVLAALPEFPGVTVETELIGGHAGEAIAAVAQTRGADEIVVGAERVDRAHHRRHVGMDLPGRGGRALPFSEGHYLQVEVAGKLAATDVPDLADQFMAFILTDAFQSAIPTTNWMYPAMTLSAGLPAGFDTMIQPEKSLLFSAQEAADIRDAALEEWRNALSQ